MNGEYYVFCRRCSVKVFNTEAMINEEGWWQCRVHNDILAFGGNGSTPDDNIFRPKIVRKPAPYTFGNAAETYWETEIRAWETIDVNWEEV